MTRRARGCKIRLVSRFPLDQLRDQVASETNTQPARRRILLIALIAILAGSVIGFLVAQAWFVPYVPPTIELATGDEDDYIIMVAEAYAVDRNIAIAQQRLSRLNDPRTTERIIALAKEYAPQQDYVAQRLALLAVAAGSKDKTLQALAATVTAPTRTPTSTRVPAVVPAEATLAPGETRLPTNTLEPNYVVVTGEPTETPTIYYIVVTGEPTATRLPTWTPTPQVSTFEERPEVILPMPQNLVAQRVPINLPSYTGLASTEIRLTARPKGCTPASQLPPIVTVTTLLCAGETYPPFELQGNNITLYGDAQKTALIQGQPRRFGVTVQGTNIAIVGVHIEGATNESDLNGWLCLYPHCPYTPELGGAVGYGGGVLLNNTSNATVMDSTFNTGTTGVFAFKGYSNKIVNNHFADHNGWGIMLMQTRSDYVLSNTFARINRSCDGLDGVYHSNGCESSALAMTNVRNTLVYDNRCRRVSNCYYANGDGGYGSTGIKFYNNQCAGAKNNCFEVTYGLGHEFDYNTTMTDADYGDSCDYPFWIGGSTAYFGPNNQWNCLHDYDTAITDARTKSDKPTDALALAERPSPTPSPTPTRRVPAIPVIAKPTEIK